MERKQTAFPLYREAFEHDSCGIGAVISIQGIQSHRTVDDALKIVEKLQHRAGRDACGFLLPFFMQKWYTFRESRKTGLAKIFFELNDYSFCGERS